MDVQRRPSDLRNRITRLGMTQTGFARLMQRLGDDRDEKNILRSIQRMVAGDNRVSGEMRALLGLLEAQQADGAKPGACWTATRLGRPAGIHPAARPSPLDR